MLIITFKKFTKIIYISKVKDEWCKIYDFNYIEDTVINGIQDKLIDLAPLLAILSEKATGKKSELVESLKEEIGFFSLIN